MLGRSAWQRDQSSEDLEQDVVEEEGAEHAAQLLPLLDVPQGESLAEVVPARLLQPSHVQTSLQLAPDNKMLPYLLDIRFWDSEGNFQWDDVRSRNLWMW